MQAEAGAQPKAGVWRTVIEAVTGTNQDFTQGSIGRAVFLLAVPMVLEMLMESLFALVDVFWVTRLGANAVATVGLTESMLALVFSVALGISFSTTAMIARRIGEKDAEGAATAAMQSIFLGIGIALAIGIPAVIFSHDLLHLMGADSNLIADGHRYTEIVFGGTASVILLFLNNAIFRGAGDAAAAMRVLWVSNAINLILDPCFIFGLGPFPKLGVTGAAVSTLIGRFLRCVVSVLDLNQRANACAVDCAARSAGARCDAIAGTSIFDRRSAIPCCALQLASACPHYQYVRQFCCGGLHDWHKNFHVHRSSFVGNERGGRHHGGPESGSEEA